MSGGPSDLHGYPAGAEGPIVRELLLALAGEQRWRQRRSLIEAAERESALLGHLVGSVPFYRQLAARGERCSRLSDLPLVSRAQLARAPAQFTARTSERLLLAKTSGTSGSPLTVSYDEAAWYDVTQDAYRLIFESLPELAGCEGTGRPAVTLVCNELNRPQAALVLISLSGGLFRRRILGRSAASDRALLEELRHEGTALLYGKASYLLDLARCERAHSSAQRIRPRAILTSGENLFEDDRALLADWFGCPVYDAYISTEGGLVALGCKQGRALHVMSERVALQVLVDGRPAPVGDGELLLTNFTNWAMPFVRYRTGDSAVLEAECACGHRGPVLSLLRGREAAWFETRAGRVSPAALQPTLSRSDVQRYELVQTAADSFSLRFTAAANGDVPRISAELCASLARQLGGADIAVQHALEITKPGAKARRFWVAPTVAEPSSAASARFARARTTLYRSPAAQQAVFAGAERLIVTSGLGTFALDAAGRRSVLCAARVSPPIAVASSADGRQVVIAYADGALRRIEDTALVNELPGGAPVLNALALAPTGGLLATGAQDGTVRVLNWTGEHDQIVTRHSAPITGLSFSADAETLASCDAAGGISLWDLATADPLPALRDPGGFASAVTFSPTSKFAAASVEAGVSVWHLASGECVGVVGETAGRVVPFAFTADGSCLVVALGAERLVLWDIASARLLDTLNVPVAGVNLICCTPSDRGQLLAAVAGLQGELLVWQARIGTEEELHHEEPRDVA